MNQADFKNLIAGGLSRDPSSASTGRYSIQEVKSLESQNYKEGKGGKKKGKGKKKDEKDEGPKYRDRAAERRLEDGAQDEGEEQGEKYSIEKSKFLGGDVKHTHLVRGLDFSLLRKVRSEMDPDAAATSGIKNNNTQQHDRGFHHSDEEAQAPPPPGLPGVPVNSLPIPSGLPGVVVRQVVAAPKQHKKLKFGATPASSSLLEGIRERLGKPSFTSALAKGKRNGTPDPDAWIERLLKLTLTSVKSVESNKLKLTAKWEDTSTEGCSRHGKALKRITYNFRADDFNEIPTQTLKPSGLDIGTKKGKQLIAAPVAQSLVDSIRKALSEVESRNVSKKKRKKQTIMESKGLKDSMPQAAPLPPPVDDDDIFADVGDYVPIGADDGATSAYKGNDSRGIFDGLGVPVTKPTETSTAAKADAFLGKFLKKRKGTSANVNDAASGDSYDDEVMGTSKNAYGIGSANYDDSGDDDDDDDRDKPVSKKPRKNDGEQNSKKPKGPPAGVVV